MTNSLRMIYVVDDDEAIRDSVRLLLEANGMTVRDFPSALAFLAQFDRSLPACLILDVDMPGMSGVELLEQLKSQGEDIPVIMMTGRNEAALTARIERAGPLAHLLKPVDFLDLIAAVELAFARKD